ncbi:MAG: hypothetical protein ACK42A_11310 [Pyrinomonadaceae bacterium]
MSQTLPAASVGGKGKYHDKSRTQIFPPRPKSEAYMRNPHTNRGDEKSVHSITPTAAQHHHH